MVEERLLSVCSAYSDLLLKWVAVAPSRRNAIASNQDFSQYFHPEKSSHITPSVGCSG